MAPLISAAVMAAKVIWNITPGMKVLESTLCSPNSWNGLPISAPLPAPFQPSDQPHSTKTMPTTPNATNDIIIMFRTDFDRVMPP